MYRVYLNIETNIVEQVFDLTAEPALTDTLKEDTFGNGMYCIDTEEPVGFNQKYNADTETFEINPDYVEPDTTVIPNKADVVEKKTKELEMGIYLTQSAVDFLLMSTASEFSIKNIKEKGDKTIMAGYLAMRIIKGMLNYKEVIMRYPEYKEEIDFILKAEGKGDLIVA
jgi:hypothetical protein